MGLLLNIDIDTHRGPSKEPYMRIDQITVQREANRMMMYEPMERMGYIGSGLSGLMQGMGPQYQFSQQPNASPLATALGIGSTLGGIYGNVTGKGN